MPLKSKAQQRFFFAAEAEGKLPKGTARKWARESKEQGIDLKKLPEKVDEEKQKKTAELVWESFRKHAAGTNTASALPDIKDVRPEPGKLKIPQNKKVGRAKGFDPEDSVSDGSKD